MIPKIVFNGQFQVLTRITLMLVAASARASPDIPWAGVGHGLADANQATR
jgi:hypothetical protein